MPKDAQSVETGLGKSGIYPSLLNDVILSKTFWPPSFTSKIAIKHTCHQNTTASLRETLFQANKLCKTKLQAEEKKKKIMANICGL